MEVKDSYLDIVRLLILEYKSLCGIMHTVNLDAMKPVRMQFCYRRIIFQFFPFNSYTALRNSTNEKF